MKRIAIISLHSCPGGQLGNIDVGGMNVYVLMLSKFLGHLGFNVDIFTRNHDDCIYPQVGNIEPQVRVIHIEVGKTNISKVDLYDYVDEFVLKVKNFSDNNSLRYNLIHSHYWLSGCAGEKLSNAWGVNHLLNFHTTAKAKLDVNIVEENEPIRNLMEKNLFFSSDAIIVSTSQEKKDLQEYYNGSPKKSYVIIPGVDLSTFYPVEKSFAKDQLSISEDFVILFVGRLDPIKGIDLLIESFAQIEQLKLARLLIVGGSKNGDNDLYLTKMKNLSKHFGVEGKVSFEGSVNQKDLYMYYNAADVCVVPSHYESFGLTIVESMACKTPVISTPVGVSKNLIEDGHTGFLINVRSPNELSKKIECILGDSVLMEKVALSSYDLVKEMSWSKMALELSEVYKLFLRE